jgi:hypothetical protein
MKVITKVHLKTAIVVLREGLGEWDGVTEAHQPDDEHKCMKIALDELESALEGEEQ